MNGRALSSTACAGCLERAGHSSQKSADVKTLDAPDRRLILRKRLVDTRMAPGRHVALFVLCRRIRELALEPRISACICSPFADAQIPYSSTGPLPKVQGPSQYPNIPTVAKVYGLAGQIWPVLYQLACFAGGTTKKDTLRAGSLRWDAHCRMLNVSARSNPRISSA